MSGDCRFSSDGDLQGIVRARSYRGWRVEIDRGYAFFRSQAAQTLSPERGDGNEMGRRMCGEKEQRMKWILWRRRSA